MKYSKLSSAKQEKLLNSLYEKLDDYFLSVLKDDGQLMQLFMLGAMSDQNEKAAEKMFEKKFGDKLVSAVEEWIEENNIDADDFGNSIDEDEFGAGYLLHLMQLLME